MRHCKDWLSTYLEYTKNQESPESFHLWSGISIIASALGRKTWVDRGYYLTYPNHYIVLVSATALCKKSTSAKIAVGIYNEVFKDIPAVSKKITLQKLVLNLGRISKTIGDSSCFLYNSELSVLIGRMGHSELMDFLTDVYECPNNWRNETKGKGTDVLHNVFVNFLGCTTPKDLSTMPDTMIDGGFAGRTIFVYSDTPRPPIHNPKLHFNSNMPIIRENLIHDLREILKITGEFTLTKEADALFKEIYDENYYDRDGDFRIHPYKARKGEHLIKLGMVVAASRRDGNIIDTNDIRIANTFLEMTEETMADSFSHVAYSHSATSKHSEKFIQLLKKTKGKLDHSIALKKLYHYVNKDEMRAMVETLEESGIIKISIQGRKKWYELIKGGKI